MENTLENKAKFFALYFGIHCLRHEELPNIPALPITNIDLCRPGLEAEYLELKPLPSISDEDAIEVAKVMKVDIYDQLKEQIITYIHGCIAHFNCKGDMSFRISDFLRSKGYALPWMGLSVEELVNIGWVKLKGETK
ncbi:MAG: hypothetical protein ACI35V_07905 [Sphingobacterium composti]|uniref:hypothetical protein n=1 Tax=Sphingobacterium composti TaxID=363260 RepID=UPI00135973DA|nr:hypothetical protein [Sphingobacterium composti Ten et al. 2007 non Yoo et al. 2007]